MQTAPPPRQPGTIDPLVSLRARVALLEAGANLSRLLGIGGLTVGLIGLIVAAVAMSRRPKAPKSGAQPGIYEGVGVILSDGVDSLTLMPNGVVARRQGKPSWAIDSFGPTIVLHDGKGGERATLGVARTVDRRTGDKTETAPSTLTLFDEHGVVLSQLP